MAELLLTSHRQLIFFFLSSVLKVAKKFSDAGESVKFAVSNGHEFHHELEEVEQTADKVVVIARNIDSQRFLMDGEFT